MSFIIAAVIGKTVLDTVSAFSEAEQLRANANQKAREIEELGRRRSADVKTTQNQGAAKVSQAELSLSRSGLSFSSGSALTQLASLKGRIEAEVNKVADTYSYQIENSLFEKDSLDNAADNLESVGSLLLRGASNGLEAYGDWKKQGGEIVKKPGEIKPKEMKTKKSIFKGNYDYDLTKGSSYA